MTVKHLCPVCGDEYINAGYHAEACTGPRATSKPRCFPSGKRMGRPPRPPIDRFWERAMPEPNTGCWLWLGANDPDGYAKFFEGRGPSFEQRAHRFAYKHFIGRVPDGLVLDHLCRNRACCNPWHLEPVTSEENVRRGRRPLAERTHCNAGHPFDEKNTYWPVTGGRTCRACHAANERRRRQERRLAA